MQMATENPLAELTRVGGSLCLDFTNTVGTHDEPRLSEHLHAYADVVWWGLRAGVLTDAQARALFARADAHPREAARVHARAVALREAVYRVMTAAAAGEPAPADGLETLNRELGMGMAHARVAPEGEGYGWTWEEGDELDRVLWPVARSAAELLTSHELRRVGQCCGDNCQWIYVDTSRNRSRRWCDMKDCGNRAKARRHYHRTRGATG
jgi:predicted RNA-binding Zn ribbon-like protein